VVDVFRRIRDELPVRLLMVGDGPELPAAEERARELGVEDSTNFLGAQEYLEDLLPLADLFLLPSEHESFGLAALEAMSAGVGVIATSVGGAPEVIRHGENGFLHAPDDVDGMAESIRGVLRDPDRLRRIYEEALAS
jgi:glycosyltransferase involved in cell wall biosynthesis